MLAFAIVSGHLARQVDFALKIVRCPLDFQGSGPRDG